MTAPMIAAAGLTSAHALAALAARARRVELITVEHAVPVRIQPIEAGALSFGATRLGIGAHFLGRHLTIAVRVRCAQALDAALNEIGLADRFGHLRVMRASSRRLRSSGGLNWSLRHGSAAGGENQSKGGDAAEIRLHLDVLHPAQGP
nr:hypothetical protein [Brevundimonas sp.]